MHFGKFLRIPYNNILKNIFGRLHLQLYHENVKNMKTLPVNLSKSILNRLSSRLTVPMLSLVLIGILYEVLRMYWNYSKINILIQP